MKPARAFVWFMAVAVVAAVLFLCAVGLVTLLNKVSGGWYHALAPWPQKGVFAVSLLAAAILLGIGIHVLLVAAAGVALVVVPLCRMLAEKFERPVLIPSAKSVSEFLRNARNEYQRVDALRQASNMKR